MVNDRVEYRFSWKLIQLSKLVNIKITFPNFGHFKILIRLAELEIGAAGRDPIADFHHRGFLESVRVIINYAI